MYITNQRRENGKWWIVSKDFEDYGPFDTEDEAWAWADKNIDDQIFDNPNALVPELRTPTSLCGRTTERTNPWTSKPSGSGPTSSVHTGASSRKTPQG